MKLTFLLVLLLCFENFDAVCQSTLAIRKSKLRELGFLIGKWDVTISRRNAGNEITTETAAIVSFSFDMDSTVIRNERHFKSGSFYELIFYNTTRETFEFISLENGVASALRPWQVDLKGRSYRYRFLSFDSRQSTSVETTVTLKAVSDQELTETFEGIAFETGATLYHNTLRMRRVL
jgi:hypothetical protein